MIDVLVINAPNSPWTSRELLIEPIDVLTVATYIASFVKKVKVFDFDVHAWGPEEFDDLLDLYEPEFVVIPFDYHIPLYTSEAIPGVQELIRRARIRDVKVVVGGRPASYYPQLFATEPGVVVVKGEMEPALADLLQLSTWTPELLNSIQGICFLDSEVLKSTSTRIKPFDLSSAPIPDRSLLDLTPYIEVRTLLSSRGCVEKCSFCPVHDFWGKWKQREFEQVVDEIELLVTDYSARKVLFLDDNATVDARRMRLISEGLRARKTEVALGCLGTFNSVDETTLRSMGEGGFRWIHFGAEFGDQKVLDAMRKRSSPERIRKGISDAKSAGLRVRTSWILDAPEATSEGLRETVDLILETEPHEVRAHFLALRAGAPWASDLVRKGSLGQQYIHSGHTNRNGSAFAGFDQEIGRLVEELGSRGYYVIRDPSEFRDIPDKSDTRFISFCPGRYGVGWCQ